MAGAIVSRARISPMRMPSGSCRSTWRRAWAKECVSAPTSRWSMMLFTSWCRNWLGSWWGTWGRGPGGVIGLVNAAGGGADVPALPEDVDAEAGEPGHAVAEVQL